MGKLEELKKLCADAFENAEDKTSIEKLATINNVISSVEEEAKAENEKYVELLKSYKDLVKHTSIDDITNKPADTPVGGEVSFENMLKDFLKNNK